MTSSDCQFTRKWGSLGKGECQFTALGSIAIDDGTNSANSTPRDNISNTGRLFVSDTGVVTVADSRIQSFTSSGKFITKWGSNGDRPGQFHLLGGIAFDPIIGYISMRLMLAIIGFRYSTMTVH